MPLKINIEEIGGDPNATPEPKALPPSDLDDALYLALENEKGVDIDCDSVRAAQSLRFRFYRRIRAYRETGVQSFSKIVITINDSTLTLREHKLPQLRINL